MGTNFAREGVARMSSTFASETSVRAREDTIDEFGHKSCSRTKTENSPWWKHYFGKVVSVREVIIVNPNCCGK